MWNFTRTVDRWPYALIEQGDTGFVFGIHDDDRVEISLNTEPRPYLLRFRKGDRPFIVKLLSSDFAAALSAEQSKEIRL